MGFVAALEEQPVRSALQRGIFPNQSSLTDSLPQEKKKKKKGQSLKTPDKRNPCRQSKNKLKDPIIKHRCYKKNKLSKIYWALTNWNICGKDISNDSQVMWLRS